MTQQLRLAIVGFGWWGQHMLRRLSASPVVRPTCVVELPGPNHDKAAQMGVTVTADYDAVLADPRIDGVILTVPNALHEDYAVRAARAGKHVFCEKPLALEVESGRRIIAACSAANVVLGIGHERRFEPAMLRVADLVAQGELGTIMHVEAAFSHDKLIHVPPGDWRTRKATSPAAGMTATGIHLTDLMIWMLGPVRDVAAISAARVLDWETGDCVTAQLGFRSGASGTLSAILYTPHFIRFHVFGHLAHVEVRNSTHPDTPGGHAELVLSRTGQEAVAERYDWTDSVSANVEAWAGKIIDDAAYIHTPAQMLENIRVLCAVAEAAEGRRTVTLGE